MNLSRQSIAIVRYVFRFWLAFRRLMPKRKCNAFAARGTVNVPAIDLIYVINLDRESGRWSNMERELKHILDSSGDEIMRLTERHSAVDARHFSQEIVKDAEIDP